MSENAQSVHTQSVAGQVKMYETEPNIKENSIHESTRTQRCNANENQGGVKEHQNGSDVKKNSNTVHKQPRSGQKINPKTEKANRQHVGKSFGTDGADVVVPKVDARDRGIDLKREAGKGRCEHGYRGGGEKSRNTQDQCADSAAVRTQCEPKRSLNVKQNSQSMRVNVKKTYNQFEKSVAGQVKMHENRVKHQGKLNQRINANTASRCK